MIGTLFFTFWIVPWIGIIGDPTEALRWSGVLDESLDERHDAEIFRAVVESMRQWENHKKNPHRTKRSASRVCYEEVGCFEDTGPFSYLEMLPSHPKDVGTRFFMYGSRKARSIPMEIPADDINDTVNNAIDPDLPTKVIVHGFGSGCEHVWVYEMRSALMSVQDCNIVCVDWSLGSAIPNYVRAAANTRLVGRQLAKLVRSLNVPLEKVHLIGFSLGAHVAGFAGAELANVSRITGLDPAGPLFESQDARARLDETDATFVDVIHSNGEQLILGGLGSWQPMGDVDFYPNGGRMQTGCSNLFLGAVSDIIWSGSIEGRSLCNHRRAYKLFTDSVSPKCRFPAFPCENGYDGLLKGDCFPCGVNGDNSACGDMGYYSDATNARGQLYLVTREEEPFCAHQYQVKVYNSGGERPARSYGKLQVTLVGDRNFNETFTMTRKDDEELLVGAILQKIVVPHPAVANLEAIEIKYTAYSGWISSGLVSWSVDKISVLDSFGKSLSICMRGLTLESGRPLHLPLYPGECNIPTEYENTTTSLVNSTKSAAMRMESMEMSEVIKSTGGIGPFTKEQNYERRDVYGGISVKNNDNNNSQKGLGPFTKEQNINPSHHDETVQIAFVPKDNEDDSVTSTEIKKSNVSPWLYVDVGDTRSNFLENTEIESGRGFSGSNFVPSSTSEQTPARTNDPTTTTTTPTTTTTTTTIIHENQGEIREPVLQITKKETGRSMRLPEITEPILRPRATRQNLKNDDYTQDLSRNEAELEEISTYNTSQATRSFTVQFLPERLAGILAQAERYARQTLLPLISQYTPSFVGNSRQDRVKYFPPLTDRDEVTITNDDSIVKKADTNGNTERSNEIDTRENQQQPSNETPKMVLVEKSNSSRIGKEMENLEITIPRLVEQTKPALNDEIRKLESFESTTVNNGNFEKSTENSYESQKNDWIPIERDMGKIGESMITQLTRNNSSRSLNHENKWMNEGTVKSWNQSTIEDIEAGPDTKIDDWIPIVDRTTNRNDSFDLKTTATTTRERENSVESVTTMIPLKKSSNSAASTSPRSLTTLKFSSKFNVDTFDRVTMETTSTTKSNAETTTTARSVERKFIPLVDFSNIDGLPESSKDMSIETTSMETHIQKIPITTDTRSEKSASKRAMIFPYAYERQKDPRTRYIPLLPEEEMGKTNPLMERDR